MQGTMPLPLQSLIRLKWQPWTPCHWTRSCQILFRQNLSHWTLPLPSHSGESPLVPPRLMRKSGERHNLDVMVILIQFRSRPSEQEVLSRRRRRRLQNFNPNQENIAPNLSNTTGQSIQAPVRRLLFH